MCIYIHTYEYAYMYSINSSVYYDVRESIPTHMYMMMIAFITFKSSLVPLFEGL